MNQQLKADSARSQHAGPRRELGWGLATLIVGALLWAFARDLEVWVFDLGVVGRVMVIVGVIEATAGLWSARRAGAPDRP